MKGSNSSNSRNHSNIFKSTQIESDLFKSVQRPLFFCTQYGTLCHPVVISSRVYLLTLAGRTPSVALPVVLQTPRSGHWWNCCSCSACPIKIPLVLSKARACAAFCGVVLCASGNHSLPSQKSFQAVKECKQQKSKECSFPLSTLNCFSVESMNSATVWPQSTWQAPPGKMAHLPVPSKQPGTAKSPMRLYRGLDEKKQ